MALGLALRTAGNIVRAGAGVATGMGVQAWGNKQQLKQAEALQKQQIAGAQEMGRFNQGMALDMWEKTGYGAQRAQMEAAGINPGLMYGGAGSGGSTQVTPGSVQGQQAEGGAATGMAMLQATQQMKMNDAQIDLMKAQENKTNVEAVKTAGVDTTKTEGEIELLKYQAYNEEEKEILTHYQAQKTKLEGEIALNKYEREMDKLWWETMNLEETWEKQMLENQITRDTYNEKVQQIRQDTIEQIVRTQAMREGIELTKDQRDKIAAEIMEANFRTNEAAHWKQWTGVANDITQSIRHILGKSK